MRYKINLFDGRNEVHIVYFNQINNESFDFGAVEVSRQLQYMVQGSSGKAIEKSLFLVLAGVVLVTQFI